MVNVDESSCISHNATCTFRIVNGSCLTLLCFAGTLLSCFTIYCLVKHVRLPYCQNLFILNVAISDVLIALSGVVRGLGIINPYFIGYNEDTGTANTWCQAYTFVGNTIWMSQIPVLLPLTIDRLVALVSPMNYKYLMTRRNCKIMIAATWIPLLVITVYDTVNLATDKADIRYQASYHRCMFSNSRVWKKVLYVIVPFITIILMYMTMLAFVKRAKFEIRRLLIVSTLIIATGLIANIPDLLLFAFTLNMNYEVAQITTVTFWYINPVCNPLIYFCSNRTTRADLKDTKFFGRRISEVVSSTVQIKRFSSVSIDEKNEAVLSRGFSETGLGTVIENKLVSGGL